MSSARGWRRRVSEASDREAPAHLPVLVDEVSFLLRPRRGGWVVDGTIGMGGHAERLLNVAKADTRLLGVDRDPEALRRAGHRLARFGERVVLRHGSFRDIAAIAADAGVAARRRDPPRPRPVVVPARRIGPRVSRSTRDETLDMRFDPTRGRTAADLVNSLAHDELARILFEYGEERHARRIARRIDERRRRAPLRPPPTWSPP